MNSKNRKIFSGIENLPRGTASDQITQGCIVLEGGAFRGLYGEGVLDALMEADINMQCTIGVSAGALNGINYVAGHIGRAARINLTYRHDKRYVGPRSMIRNKGVMGFDFLFEGINVTDPIDEKRMYDPTKRFIAVATNCITGKAHCFDRDTCSNIYQAIRASASMPFVSKMVMIDGYPYLDGGCSNKVPYQWALKEGYEKIIVVRTRPLDYRRKPASPTNVRIIREMYRHYPELKKKLLESNDFYNYECDEMERLAKEGRIYMIAPSGPVEVSRLEGDMEKLGELYYMGYNDGKKQINAIKKYLER